MRCADESHRKAHCCRDSTSFSSCPGHCSRMKRLSTTRNFCVRQHAQSLSALPLYKPHLPTLSTLFVTLFIFRCRLSCSAAQPRGISTPHLPTIEFAQGPRPPQPRAASFSRLYRTRAGAPCSRELFSGSAPPI